MKIDQLNEFEFVTFKKLETHYEIILPFCHLLIRRATQFFQRIKLAKNEIDIIEEQKPHYIKIILDNSYQLEEVEEWVKFANDYFHQSMKRSLLSYKVSSSKNLFDDLIINEKILINLHKKELNEHIKKVKSHLNKLEKFLDDEY